MGPSGLTSLFDMLVVNVPYSFLRSIFQAAVSMRGVFQEKLATLYQELCVVDFNTKSSTC